MRSKTITIENVSSEFGMNVNEFWKNLGYLDTRFSTDTPCYFEKEDDDRHRPWYLSIITEDNEENYKVDYEYTDDDVINFL